MLRSCLEKSTGDSENSTYRIFEENYLSAIRLLWDCYETFRISTKELLALSINDCRNFGRIRQEISVDFSAIVAVVVVAVLSST